MKKWWLAFIKRFMDDEDFRYLVGVVLGVILGVVVVVGVAIGAGGRGAGVIVVGIVGGIAGGVAGGVGVVVGVVRGVAFLTTEILPSLLLNKNRYSFLDFFSSKKDQIINSASIKKHSILKSFLPSNKVEEIIGDLAEVKLALEEEGYSKHQVWIRLTFTKLIVVVSFKWRKMVDWFTEKTQINK